MSPEKLRLLAIGLEFNFITEEDRHGWVSDLRGFAKQLERERADAREGLQLAAMQGADGEGK